MTTDSSDSSPAVLDGGGAVKPVKAGIPAAAPSAPASRRRPPAERLEREAAARRALFAASLCGFAIAFGLIAVAGKPDPVIGAEDPVSIAPAAGANQVLAEVPVAGLTTADGRETIVRIVAPQARARTPHVRTRAS
jgi:hypothetical protein